MTAKEYIKLSKKYIDDVLSGARIAGELEIKAVKRHINDCKNAIGKEIRLDEMAAMKAFSFFTLLKHSKGEFSGKPFILSPWQCFVVYSIFGWRKVADGSRRYKYAYVEVARKNGKSTFAAAIALYMMIFDGEQGAEVYTAATKFSQAKIVWDEAKNMVNASSALKKYIKVYQRTLVMESTISKMESLSADSGKLDGLNPNAIIVDEFHAHKTDGLYNVLSSATGARKSPLMFLITTAGLNKTYPCFIMRGVYIDILNGVKVQDNTFVLIFTLDEKDDWKDPSTWVKANPNIDIAVSSDYLEEEYTNAINMGGTKEVNFLTKHLNKWVDAPDVWINDDIILAADYGTDPDDLTGLSCYAGLDLSSHVDITALALFFPDVNGKRVVKMHYWIPEAKVTENDDLVDYRTWWHEGRIFVTPGSVIDIDEQVRDIVGIIKKYEVLNLSFDPAKAYHGCIQGLSKEGFQYMLDEYAQSIRNMSEPSKFLEKILHGGEVDLLKDPVLRWMFRNVVILQDTNDNIRPDKKRSQNKIDGVVALITALGGYLSKQSLDEMFNSGKLRIINI